MANELQTLSDDINVITAEINAYQRVAGEAIFEIGRRLHGVKYDPERYGLPVGTDKHGNKIVARGAWGEWLADMNIHDRMARQFITIHSEIGGKRRTSSVSELGMQALYEIATMPESEREQPHELPDGTTKMPDEMTVKELRETKKRLKEAQQDFDKAMEAARQRAEDAETSQKRTQAEIHRIQTDADRKYRDEANARKQAERIAERNATELDAAESKARRAEEMARNMEREMAGLRDELEAASTDHDSEEVRRLNAKIWELEQRMSEAAGSAPDESELRRQIESELRSEFEEQMNARIEQEMRLQRPDLDQSDYLAQVSVLTVQMKGLRKKFGWLADNKTYNIPEKSPTAIKVANQLHDEIEFFVEVQRKLAHLMGERTVIDAQFTE